MPKRLIKRFIPDHQTIRNHRHLKIFGQWIHDPNLWHLNRRSVSGAFAVGLFMAFVPLPFQMLLAAGAAIVFGINLPLAVALVWISNPLTMPPMFYFAYRVGTWMLDIPARPFEIEFTLHWFLQSLNEIGAPLLLGCLTCGVISAMLGYIGIRLFWRWYVAKRWRERRAHAP